MPIFGVDVSRHQGTGLDWAKIRASGIDFMIARASLATTPDGTYRRNVARALSAGMPLVGGYHFLYPSDVVSPVLQARLFVSQLGDAEGLLAMLDVEKDRNKAGRVFIPTIRDIRPFAAEFARLTGGHPLILYAPSWYWNGHIGNPLANDLGPLCQSHYVQVDEDARGNPIRMTPKDAYARVPPRWWRVSHGGWTRSTILQFTSTGKVAGHNGRIDLNAFDGPLAKLAELTRRPGSAPVPPLTAPVRAPVVTTITQPRTPPRPPVVAQPPPVPVPPPTSAARFHRVVSGDTLSAIAARNGFRPRGSKPAFRVMIEAFPENAQFRPNPNLIRPGQRVRVK